MADPVAVPLRAFQLAEFGLCRTIADIKDKLRAEGCAAFDEHLEGNSIRIGLIALMRRSNWQTFAGGMGMSRIVLILASLIVGQIADNAIVWSLVVLLIVLVAVMELAHLGDRLADWSSGRDD